MAGSVNKVILVGNLGKDPEVRRMTVRRSGGQSVHRHLRKLARQGQRRAQGKDRVAPGGDLQQEPGRCGREISEKGAKVYVEGQLQTRKWTDKDGAEKYSTEVVLQNFRGELTMLDGRGGEGGGGGGGGGRGAGEAPASFQRDEMDDEIPF